MAKLIIVNGSDHDPSWADNVVISYDFTGDTTLNPTAAPSAGGMLLDGTTYYYKVIARMANWIVEEGDSATQLSAWSLTAPHGFKCFWELTNSGTTRRVTLYSSTNTDYMLATGTRTGDGSITLTEKNGSGINGSVTVAYTADDSGSDNILTYTCDAIVGFDEVNATPSATNLSVDLAWDAPMGSLIEYRIYRGTTTAIYDYFYKPTTNTYTDTGSCTPVYDEIYPKHRIINPSTLFIPATTANGTVKDARCVLEFGLDWGEPILVDYDLKEITNQPTWNLGTEAATSQARIDFNSWL